MSVRGGGRRKVRSGHNEGKMMKKVDEGNKEEEEKKKTKKKTRGRRGRAGLKEKIFW